MKADDIQLGMRVRRRGGETSFLRDRPGNPALQGRRTCVVIGLPEPTTAKQRGVRVQYENSTFTELVPIHRLEPLPLTEQPEPLQPLLAAALGCPAL
jgi:hypothetical protein